MYDCCKLKKIVLTVWLAGLLLFSSFLPCLGVNAEPNLYEWRGVGRKATIALEHERYDEAIRLYRRALQMQKPEDLSFEINANLKVAMAESLLRQKKFAAAKMILDELAPQMARHPESDPMLPARYWRRRAHLLKRVGQEKLARECDQKSVEVVARYFPPDNDHFVTCWSDLAQSILTDPKDTNTIVCCLRLLRSPQGDINVSRRLKREYDALVTHVLINTLNLVKNQDFDRAATNLEALAQVDKYYRAIGGWWFWIHWSIHKNNRKLEPAIRALCALMPRIQRSGNLRAELEAHYCLALAYENQRKNALST